MMKSILIMLTVFCTGCNSPAKDISVMEATESLQLSMAISNDTIERNNPLNIRLVLTNVSEHPVLVNARMAVGFRDQISREIFFEIRGGVNEEVISLIPVDINREDAEKEDYQYLKAGENIEKELNLFQFYMPEASGELSITAFYQADEEAINRPENIVKGIIESNSANIFLKDKSKN